MIDLSPPVVLLIMFSSLALVILSGLPVAFVLGGIGVILTILVWGTTPLTFSLTANAFMIMTWYTIIAVPLFVFMSVILRTSGVVEDLFYSIRLWFGRVPGGLAVAVVVVSVFIAAMSGITATGILILGIVALPLMLKLGYSKGLAMGSIIAGSALGELIPPSTGFIFYAAIANASTGQLFMGGIIPGFIMSGLFIAYVEIRCLLNPALGPPLPPEERGSWREKFSSLKGLILPLALIAAVLGSIFMGVACATESAGIGAIGALVCAAVRRNLSWKSIKQASIVTFEISSMAVWIIIGSFCFKSVFTAAGGPQFVAAWVVSLNIASLSAIFVMLVCLWLMGCFITDAVIIMIAVPVFLPVVEALGYTSVWFGVVFLCALQSASLTPPFGWGFFSMRSVAPEGITMRDIIRACLPFIPLQIITTPLVLFLPKLALWLPSLMIK